jgi:hypothetical protein
MITGTGERGRVFACVPPARLPMLINMEIHSVRTVIYLLVGIILLLVPLGCTTPSTQPSKTDAPPSVAPAAQPQVEGWRQRWTVEKSENALDNSSKVVISNAEVVIRCSQKRLDGYVFPDLQNLGHMLDTNVERTSPVRYRLDDSPVRRANWVVSDSFDALFFPDAVLKQLPEAHTLILEYKPEYVIAETMTIDLSGLKEALASAGCNLGSHTVSADRSTSQGHKPAGINTMKSSGDYAAGPGGSAQTLANLEVLSDTAGVDFGPYLSRVLDSVRKNWYNLTPEAARAPLLKRGKVAIEFAILPDGRVAGMKITGVSGDVSLARAAWGGITASNPFAPLPSEYHAPYLALRFRFYYNAQNGDME